MMKKKYNTMLSKKTNQKISHHMQNITLNESLSLSINLLLKEEVTKELNKDPYCSAKQIHPQM
jgi:ribosomal protein S3AE